MLRLRLGDRRCSGQCRCRIGITARDSRGALENDLVNRWRRGEMPNAAALNVYRVYANEFYDTPASQISRGGGSPPKPENRFARNAHRVDPS